MERWFDTIHTFHLPFGELTLDPVSFTAITEITYTEDPSPFDVTFHHMSHDKLNYVERLLGMVPDMKGTHTIKHNLIRTFYTWERVTVMISPCEINQVV